MGADGDAGPAADGTHREGPQTHPRATVVVATRNQGKVVELRALLVAHGVDAITLDDAGVEVDAPDELVECHDTFAANAVAKAHWYARLLPGRTVIADDSGLEVEALNGAPGVRSKRASGRTDLVGRALDEANIEWLLKRLQPIASAEARRARFVCAAGAVGPWGEAVRVGFTRGRILQAPSGTYGFGYDPVFLSDDLGVSFGVASAADKARVSHRARAMGALVPVVISMVSRPAHSSPVDPPLAER